MPTSSRSRCGGAAADEWALRGMGGAEVIRVLDALEAAGIRAGITGGWGIDALLRRETRAHGDLDLGVAAEAVDRAIEAVRPLGIRRDPRRTAGPSRRGERSSVESTCTRSSGGSPGRACRPGRPGRCSTTPRAASTPKARSRDGRSAARHPICNSRSTRTTNHATTTDGTWRRSRMHSGYHCRRPIGPEVSASPSGT